MRPENTTDHAHDKARVVTRIYRKWLHHSTAQQNDSEYDDDRTNNLLLVEALNWVLHAWKQQSDASLLSESDFDQVLAIFTMTLENALALNSSSLMPQDKTFSSLFDILALNASHQTLQTARDLLKERLRLTEQHLSAPDVQFWNSYLNVLAKSSSIDSSVVEEAEEVLGALGKDADDRSVASVLETWAHSGLPQAGERAQHHLDRMVEQGRLNSVCFNLAIRAWATTLNPDRAEACLMQMIGIHDGESSHSRLVPDAISFLEVIRGWGKVGQPKKAERILRVMQALHEESGNEQLRPSGEILVALLQAWTERRNGGPQAERLLQASIDRLLSDHCAKQSDWLSPQAFAVGIKAWATTDDPHAPLKAQSLITQMEQLQEAGFESLSPNHFHYSALINTWTKTERTDVSEQVMDTLRVSIEKVGPQSVVYNSALAVLARHGKVNEVEELLEEMHRLQHDPSLTVAPDATSYSSVIRAFYNSRHDEAASRADELLRHTEETFDRGSAFLCPNEAIYLSAILAHSLKSVEAAEDVFWRMHERCSRRRQCPAPSLNLVNLVLQLWAWSNDGRAPQKAEAFLRLVLSCHDLPQPNDTSYVHVIRAWGRSGRRLAILRVENLLLEMSRDRSLKVEISCVREIELALGELGQTPTIEECLKLLYDESTKY